MRVIIAGILGGIAMFVWTSIAHVALPLGQIGFSQIPNENRVLGVLHDSLGKRNGLFFFPWIDVKQPNAMAAAEAKRKTNPSGLLIYHPPGGDGMTSEMLIIEFVKEAIVSLIAALLLAQTVLSGYAARVGFVALAGVAAAMTTSVSYWNWYGFPTNYTAAYMTIDFLGYLAAGLVIAGLIRPRTR